LRFSALYPRRFASAPLSARKICNSIFSRSKAANFNPNSDFGKFALWAEPVLRRELKHLFGVGPAIESQTKSFLTRWKNRPRLTRQIPKLRQHSFGIWAKKIDQIPRLTVPRFRNG
jgi:hypothetical protein